jgi:hypothetical protein
VLEAVEVLTPIHETHSVSDRCSCSPAPCCPVDEMRDMRR